MLTIRKIEYKIGDKVRFKGENNNIITAIISNVNGHIHIVGDGVFKSREQHIQYNVFWYETIKGVIYKCNRLVQLEEILY